MLISKQFELTSLCVCVLKNGAYCLFSLGPIPLAFTSRHWGEINENTFGIARYKAFLDPTFGYLLCLGLFKCKVRVDLGSTFCREKKVRQKIFVSIMKWQSPNFIKAKCSDPNTIVHSFYFWKAFIVLITVNEFCGGLWCNHKIRGPFAPSSGRVLSCNRKW